MTSGRSGTHEFQRNRPIVLAASDVCGICGHPGSQTVDHIVSARLWPKDRLGRPLPGLDGLPNLQPAHGTMGAGRNRRHNPCPYCGRLCNQSKSAGVVRRPATRQWFPDRL